MSALSTRIRDAWLPIGKSYVYSKTLPGSAEQALGCDTLILVHDDDGAKVCLLESKWPRVATQPSYKWDRSQKIKGKRAAMSHFSDQIARQRSALPEAVIAEMFLVEDAPGVKSSLLYEYGATVVMHADASLFDATHRIATEPWSNRDFWELIGFAGEKATDLGSLIYALASCEAGEPIPIVSGAVTLGSGEVVSPISIPISIDRLIHMGPEICERLGLSTLLTIELPWIG